MNKKLLLLAGILVLGATSFAASGARDFIDTFDSMKPTENITGHWDQELKVLSDTESKDDKQAKLKNEIGLNLTDKLSLALETNTHVNYPGKDNADADDLELSMTYKSGQIADTKLNLSHTLKTYREGSKKSEYSYKANVDFSKYLSATAADASLEYKYAREEAKQTVEYEIETVWALGAGFTTKADLVGTVTTSDSSEHEMGLELTLNYDKNLYTSEDEASTLAFHTEASVTPVKYNPSANNMHSTKVMLVETETYMKLNRKWTNNFSTYGTAGVTTADDTKKHTSNFGTQGYVALGLSYAM